MLKRTLTLLLFILLLLAGCGGEQAGSEELDISGVWGRPSPLMAETGAFYMQIVNNTGVDDALLGVSAGPCGMAELHESSLDDQGVMRMEPVAGQQIPLPAGSTVLLRPGGLHVMCMQMAEPLVAGTQVPLILHFAEHPDVEVAAEIGDEAP